MKRRVILSIMIVIMSFISISCMGMVDVTLYFDSNGGSEVSNINTDGSSVITIPDDPTKDGYIFRGWFWDNNTFLRSFTANSLVDEPISQNMTVYAKWISEDIVNSDFTVTFNVNGGSSISTQTIHFDGLIIEPDYPTKLGYLFQGWYKEGTLTNLWNFNSDTVEGDTILYAEWDVAPTDYYIVNFISNSDQTVPSQQIYKATGLDTPNISREGYTLDGWYTSLDGGVTLAEKWSFTSNVVNSNLVLYAKWNINEYTITFNTNGGNSINPITQNYNTPITTPSNPDFTGYVFGGWYSNIELTNEYTFETMPSSNITIYAKWLRTVTFVTNGSSSIPSLNLAVDEALSEPDALTKVGNTFVGWYRNSTLTTPFTFSTMPDENLTLYVKWNVNQYTITFESNEGSTVNPITQNYNSTLIQPANPTKEGYTFIGWYSNVELTNSYTFSTVPANDLTVYAKWQINEYTISFNVNEGTEVLPITMNYGETVTEPNSPTKEGNTFIGWYLESSLSNPYVFSTMQAQNITIYASWSVNQYTTNFETNGGNSITELVFDFGSSIVLPEDPTKDGVTFAGWYLDSDLTNILNLSTMPSQDFVLYAKWQKNISFESNGGTEVPPILADVGTSISSPLPPTQEGYTFVGWYTDIELMNEYVFTTMPEDNLILYAKWEINQYTISFETNSGSEITPLTQDYLSIVVQPANPDKEGYTFIGWYSDIALTNEYVFDHMPSSNITIYAKWSVNQYTITFNTNDGSGISSITGDFGSAVNEPAQPTKIFYSFGGWYSDESLTLVHSFSTMPATDSSVYAKWIPNDYTITFNLNGGTGDSSLTQAYTSELTEPIPTKTGYSFIGWFTDSGLTNQYEFTTMPAQDFPLYAKWSINSYTLSFESNGGTNIDSIVKLYGTSMPTITDPVKEGFTFVGWYIDSEYVTIYSYLTIPANDVTLYAKWENTIAFDSNDGTSVTSITEEAGTSVTKPSNPNKEGYTFVGWYSDVELTQAYSFTTMPSLNITIYAKWIVNQYIIGFETNGGSYISTITQDYNMTVNEPTEPTRDGYTFGEWYSDEELTIIYTFITMPAEDIILYAKWDTITYDITYQLDGGINETNPDTYTVEKSTITLDEPTKEGYTFGGWFDNAELTGDAITEITLGNTGDITLYAKWTINQYIITYEIFNEEYNPMTDIPLLPEESFVSISLTKLNSAVVTSSGRVFIWGAERMFDDPSHIYINYIPVEFTFNLPEGEKIVAISLGDGYKVALTSEGRIFTWGLNSYCGQLGDGTTTSRASPIDITSNFSLSPNESIIMISTGIFNSIALTSAGRVFAWGHNGSGQLGDGTGTYRTSPIDITNSFNLYRGEVVTSISLGRVHSVALTSKGRVFTWGNNSYGQLGIGTKDTNNHYYPIEITSYFNLLSEEEIVSIILQGDHSSALSSSGRVFTWGRNDNGQLGDGTTVGKSEPTEVSNRYVLDENEMIISISIGGYHSAVLTSTGRVLIQGKNYYGQLGDGTTTDKTIPMNITSYFNLNEGEKIIHITLGVYNSSVLTSEGRVFIWGYNNYGNLGDGRNIDKLIPTLIETFAIPLLLDVVTYNFSSTILDFVPLLEGYSFGGWYADKGLTIVFDFTVMPANSLILYSCWERD